MSNNEVDEFFKGSAGSKYPAFKFIKLKDGIKGRILSTPKLATTKNMTSGEPEKVVIIEMEALEGTKGSYNDKQADGDTLQLSAKVGENYALWVRKGFLSGAIGDACSDAGKDGLSQGDTLIVVFDEKRDTGKASPAKVYKAKLEPGKPVVSTSSLLDNDDDEADESASLL